MSFTQKRPLTINTKICNQVNSDKSSSNLSSPSRKKIKNDCNASKSPRTDKYEGTETINLKNNKDSSQSPLKSRVLPKFTEELQKSSQKENFDCTKDGILKKENDFNSLTTDNVFKITGLSQMAQDVYRDKRNISDLYDWQKECITNKELLNGKNFILSLQTGAGKTLIAELLMLRETLFKNKSCILILPYVAIVQEKILSLSVFDELGIYIEEYAGSKGRIPPIKRRKGQTIYVATIEKGLVVIDELHMIGEKGRGAIIEQLIFKYLFFGSGQIVGMSATLGNIDTMRKFMKAEYFSSDFRPVELIERVKIGDTLFNVTKDGDLVQHEKLEISQKLKNVDSDGVITLIKDVVPKKSVIIFCPTKSNCENVCKMIAKLAPKAFKKPNEKREEIINNIKNENDGEIEETMEIGIRAGIAYHHSGLTSEERHWIETAFQNNVLYALCATSTLAAGVNLPARRVIIKQPMVGAEFLGKSQYLQMIGRAGRAGYDDKGESITVVSSANEKPFKNMLKSKLNSCQSKMFDEKYLEGFLLDLIYLRCTTSVNELPYYISSTLAGIQNNEECLLLLDKALENLKARGMIKIVDEKFVDTFLGGATFFANLSPDCANLLNDSLLQDLDRGVVFSSHFHLILTLIPYDVAAIIDWDIFHDDFRKLSESEKLILAKMNIQEQDILCQITARKKVDKGSPSMRLYIAFIMMDVWNKIPLSNVAKKYKVQKGWLQNTLQSVCSQAQRIQRFSELLEKLWPLKLLLPYVISKLNECKNAELVPLMNLDCVKFGRAKILYDKGFKTVKAIADAKPSDLLNSLEQISLVQAKRIIKSAKTAIDQMLVDQEEQRISYGLISK